MEPASKTIQRWQESGGRTRKAKPLSSINANNIGRLWLRLTEIYGHKWVSAHGESDESGTWLKGLSGLKPAQLSHGLSACMNREEAWPPTLPEFRRMCTPNLQASHKLFQQLPAPPVDKSVGLKFIAEIREGLK